MSYNLACLGQVIGLFNLDEEVILKFYRYIIKHPEQRFGQIMCNYICPDYRDGNISDTTKEIMNKLFPNDPDPFYEEPWITFKRYEEQDT